MKKAKFKVIFAAIFMFALLAVGMIAPANFATVYAAENTYSSALEDLKKDPAFRSADYPAKTDAKYSFNVIQIAESATGELFVYTYQPSAGTKKLSATSISISTTINENYEPKLYKLKELNAQGVFGKYLVNGFRVQSGSERHYDISEIFRAWNKSIDQENENGNVISEVSFKVGKYFKAITENGQTKYECRATETRQIVSKYCGYLRPQEGSITSVISYDEHFIAFDTDISIDQIFKADIAFSIRMRKRIWVDGVKTNDRYVNDFVETQVTVSCEELTNANFIVPWEKPKTWKTIETVSEFIAKENLTTEAKEKLADKQWVLRFLRTPYTYKVNGFPPFFTAELITEEIADETILQLNYEKDGKVYNLGVIDNKQSPAPDAPPDNTTDLFNPFNGLDSFWNWLVKVWNSIVNFFTGKSDWWVYVVVVIAALILLPTILGLLIPAFGKLLLKILKALGKGLWWLICLPFRIIAAPFKAIAKRRKKDKSA